MQDQEEEMQQEAAEDYEQMQEALREGPQEEEAAVPEDLLRARLRGGNYHYRQALIWGQKRHKRRECQAKSLPNRAGPAQTRLRALGPDKNKEVRQDTRGSAECEKRGRQEAEWTQWREVGMATTYNYKFVSN